MNVKFILGPTASGKSELAYALARESNAAILVMDAMQVYRGADIGTSKPTAAEQKEIPHGGIDLVDIGQPFSVADYLAHAAQFLAAHQSVLIVGGTGLYYRALTQGLCEAPAAPKELKEELMALSLPQLQERLKKADPEICAALDMQNPRRIQRALEVIESTGVSLRVWQKKNTPPLVTDFKSYFISRTKTDLDARIAARVDAMLASGWLDEVHALVKQNGVEKLRSFPAIGYAQLTDVQNDAQLSQAREKIVFATRQYAKRQLTWFARERNLIQIMVNKNDSPLTFFRNIPA